MSFWDMFKPKQPTRQPLPEIKLAHKPGTFYYLRARNLYSGFDDILCFEDEPSRTHYMEYGTMSTPNPSDWYFDCWEETAEERAQQSLTDQRNTLLQSFETDKRALEHRLRAALQKYNECKADKERIAIELQQATYDYKEYKHKFEQLQSAPAPTPASTTDTKTILQAIQKDLHTILCKANPELLEQYASEYEQELSKLGKQATPLQRGLTLAIIARQLNNI